MVLQCQIGEFPYKYRGLQLAIKKLTKADWQLMLDQAKNFVLVCQRVLIRSPGRLVLIKSVIATKPIHHLMVSDAPAWVFEELDKSMHSFFWVVKEWVNGG